MKCYCCNRLLNDFESTRKSKTTGEYLDMCNKCYTTIAPVVKTESNDNFEPFEIPDDEAEFDENDWGDEWED